jgi:methylaspartate mutase sigma subunit
MDSPLPYGAGQSARQPDLHSYPRGAVLEVPPRPGLTVLLTGVASDSHTWNLVFLELLFTELGHRVINLGPCVPPELLVRTGQQTRPDLIVMSSVNGHGLRDGVRAMQAVRRCPELVEVAAIIGGKLGITGLSDRADIRQLLDAGFDAVFEDADGVQPLDSFLASLAERLAPTCIEAS